MVENAGIPWWKGLSWMGKSIVDHIPEFSKCFWLPSLKDSLPIFPQVFGMKSKFINLRKPRQWEFFLGDLSFGIPHSEVEDDEMGVSSYRWKIPAVAIGKSCCPKYSKFVSEFVVPPLIPSHWLTNSLLWAAIFRGPPSELSHRRHQHSL